MNSRKAKTVDSSGVYLGRSSSPGALLRQQAVMGGAPTSSRMLAWNTANCLQIQRKSSMLWLDKRRARVFSDARFGRTTQPWRQLAAQLRHLPHSVWHAQASGYCRALGIDFNAQRARGLEVVGEPRLLVCHEQDAHGRWLWLHPDAQRAWSAMRAAAQIDGIMLRAVSGWRSIHYQAQLLQRKLKRGQLLADVLQVSAAPGFSEHHAGTALDLAGAAELALEERFEHTVEFAWLRAHAGRFGFVLSLPRGNSQGYSYEPWHWRLTAAG